MIEKFLFMAHALPTDLTNSTQGLMTGMALWAYNVTMGTFWSLMLLGFCIVLYISTSKYTGDRAFGFAGVTGLLGSIFLLIMNLMPWWIASAFILVGAMSIAFMIMRER